MSSIPLPALDLKPVQQPDIMANYGHLLQLQNMAQTAPLQRQALQQQIQTGELENQQKQIALKDQQAMSAAMNEWATPKQSAPPANMPQGMTGGPPAPSAVAPDYDSLLDLARKHGVSFAGYQGLQQHILDMKQKAATIAKDDAQRGTDEANALKTKNGMLTDAMTGVANLPDNQLIPGLLSAAQQLGQSGLLDPQHVQMAQQLAQTGDPATIRKMLGIQIAGMGGFTKMLDDEQKKLTNQKTSLEMQYGEPQYRAILAKKASGQELTPDELNTARAFEASNTKSSTTSDTLGVTSANTSKPGGLAAVGAGASRTPLVPGGTSPQAVNAKQGIVDEIGQYKMDPQMFSRVLAKHPEIPGLIQAKYPDWDQTTYQAKNSLMKGFTSGSQSKEINAINTTMGHVKVLDDAVDALNNGNLTILNKLGNSLGINVTGQTAPAAFKLIVHRVGPEIASSYIPGGGGEMERVANEKDFDENLPGQTLHNNAAITVNLLRSKIGALENQYKNTVGRDDFTQRFLTPEAQSSLQKFGGGNAPGGGGNVVHYKIVNGQLVAK
jgi:hypothetical protein